MGHSRDDPRGALVRPYAVTRGRTEPTQAIAIEAVLVTSPHGLQEAQFTERDRRTIAMLCSERPQSMAEIAAYLGMPLGVGRVLVSDMVSAGILILHTTEDSGDLGQRIDVLERVLVGLRRL
ncbi:MAG: DUF742 domain-containing protein [Dactylosporangium sp.]|nr:DUF742 domain-containing protein [Dactylosporangium sp.]NNJ60444.1 DUF742 domain-containing protein [Dactylosporangium sp.]